MQLKMIIKQFANFEYKIISKFVQYFYNTLKIIKKEILQSVEIKDSKYHYIVHTELLKLKESNQYQHKSDKSRRKSSTEIVNICLENDDSKNSRVITNQDYNITNDSYSRKNIANLVKDSINITKQTNIIEQAILLSMPINKPFNALDILSNSFDTKKILDSRILENQFIRNCQCTNGDLNNNFGTSKTPVDYELLTKHESSDKQSVHSVHSDCLNSDYKSSCGDSLYKEFTQETNANFDEVKHNNISKLNHIDIKYPSNFAKLNFNKNSKIGIHTTTNVINIESLKISNSELKTL